MTIPCVISQTSLPQRILISFVPIISSICSYSTYLKEKISIVSKRMYNAITPSSKSEGVFYERKYDGYLAKNEHETSENFFVQLMPKASQRESWFTIKRVPHVAEFWNTLSSIGFVGVGLYYSSPELIFAGVASAASHAFPKNWLLLVDKIGAGIVVFKFALNYEILMNEPWLLAPVAATGATFAMDTMLAGKIAPKFPWPHVAWHITATTSAGMALSYVPSSYESLGEATRETYQFLGDSIEFIDENMLY